MCFEVPAHDRIFVNATLLIAAAKTHADDKAIADVNSETYSVCGDQQGKPSSFWINTGASRWFTLMRHCSHRASEGHVSKELTVKSSSFLDSQQVLSVQNPLSSLDLTSQKMVSHWGFKTKIVSNSTCLRIHTARHCSYRASCV